ncbi:hypothetical protein COX58_02825 [archaeon CG_4_10_14_0_2_um_filter_Archaea_38_6]|nr:MAG: hypothetical protein COS83_04425 [archaeon CG07_land_8_20_14_0_80_38_8]PIU89253.1 MAG: hypothetical protein COS64_01555 [archaeon CG06_land_8_20_14_3_00_37_11]PJA22113.1 MAG: hypothetical protein COX58_02825 [archaeon CG_4_10_14_0_2_um_filter_Archaea_38_6]
MNNTCFVYAMDCEGKRLNELLEEEYNKSVKQYLITDLTNIYNVKESDVLREESSKIGKYDIKEFIKLEYDKEYFYAPVYTLNKFRKGDKLVYTLESQVRIDNAVRASRILNSLRVNNFINIGLSGALQEDLGIGDVICSNKSMYKEINSDVFKTINVKKPKIVLGDYLVCPTGTTDWFCEVEEKKNFRKITGAYSIDVESAVIASNLRGNIELYRVISDELNDSQKNFCDNISSSVKFLDKFVEELIENL